MNMNSIRPLAAIFLFTSVIACQRVDRPQDLSSEPKDASSANSQQLLEKFAGCFEQVHPNGTVVGKPCIRIVDSNKFELSDSLTSKARETVTLGTTVISEEGLIQWAKESPITAALILSNNVSKKRVRSIVVVTEQSLLIRHDVYHRNLTGNWDLNTSRSRVFQANGDELSESLSIHTFMPNGSASVDGGTRMTLRRIP